MELQKWRRGRPDFGAPVRGVDTCGPIDRSRLARDQGGRWRRVPQPVWLRCAALQVIGRCRGFRVHHDGPVDHIISGR
eukprot:4042493-Prymnesium_polylepis.1